MLGTDARRSRERQRRKAQLRVLVNDEVDDDFEASVRRDLDALPTIEEPHTGPKRRAP